MDLTEAEDIKKRWQEYTEELYKKDLHDPDNHDGMCLSAMKFTFQINLYLLKTYYVPDSMSGSRYAEMSK